MNSIYNIVKPSADRNKHTFILDLEKDVGDIVIDRKWLMQILINILNNAIKYTPPGGMVTVSTREYEMFVCIDVTDSGIGMTEEETAKIFTRFYRSPRVYEEKGVGIGLYLAREIVSKEGGYIKVTSELFKGSVFSVFLPKLPGHDSA